MTPELEMAGRAMALSQGIAPDATMTKAYSWPGNSTSYEMKAWEHYAAMFAVGLSRLREPTDLMRYMVSDIRSPTALPKDAAPHEIWWHMAGTILEGKK